MKSIIVKSRSLPFVAVVMAIVASITEQEAPDVKTEKINR